MQTYASECAEGRYDILMKGDALYWRSTKGIEYLMVPLTGDLFGFTDSDRYRVEILRDDMGVVTGFRLLTRGGEPGTIRARTNDN